MLIYYSNLMAKPSDLGFEDNGFHLPELNVREHVVKAASPRPGLLFVS